MSAEVNTDAARRFLEWYFDGIGTAKIGLSFQRSDPDKARAAAKKNEATARVFSTIDAALDSTVWSEKSPDHKVYYCTTPLFRQEGNSNTAANAATLPAFYVDIDGMRDLNVDGDVFWGDIKDTEAASCWVRTSSQGLQAIFKLDQAIAFDEEDVWDDSDQPDVDLMDEEDIELWASTARRTKPKKVSRDSRKATLFTEEIKPLLWNICYYFGGDPKVVSLARLLRVPGTLNIKYDPPYKARAYYAENVTFTLAELRKKFSADPNRVPRLVYHVILTRMQKHCAAGNNHYPLLALWGTVRKAGIDRASCHTLRKELTKFLGTRDGESESVETTYDGPLEEQSSLFGEVNGETFEDISEDISTALKFWVDLKVKYCKALKIDWTPEARLNPIDGPIDESLFYVRNGDLYWSNPPPKRGGDPGPCKIANFSVRTLYKIIKQDEVSGELREIDYAALTFRGMTYTFEWPSEKDTDFSKFKTLPGLPPKIAFTQRDCWGYYIDWLSQQPVPLRMIEKKSYGIMDYTRGTPTLLLPKPCEHPEYTLTRSTFDTASPQLDFGPVDPTERATYLARFGRSYATYHNPHYIWPSLGWFASAVYTEIAFNTLHGFPVLLIWGLAGSGKTTLIKHVLANHYGCLGLQDFKTTTNYSQRKALASNNIVPLLLDEFRDSDENKTSALQAQINILFDRNYRNAAGVDGQASLDKLIGSMCILGEHAYQDEAALHRTYMLKVTLDYLQELRVLDDEEKSRRQKRQRWLESPQRNGMMVRIQLDWISTNFDRAATIYREAFAKIEECSAADVPERALLGRAVVFGGLMCLAAMYSDYEIEWPLTVEQMLAYTLEGAAEANSNSDNYGSNILKTLWQETDFVITDALRNSRTLAGLVYSFDPRDKDVIYFEVNRWYKHIQPQMKASKSATLMNFGAFKDLLTAATRNENSPILEYPSKNPVLGVLACKCSLSLIQAEYQVNPLNWQFIDNAEERI